MLQTRIEAMELKLAAADEGLASEDDLADVMTMEVDPNEVLR
jgi:hypothetical protein